MTMLRRLGPFVVMFLVCALAVAPDAHSAQQASTPITIDATSDLGPLNADLVGLGSHEGGAPLSTVADLQPRLVRLDAKLQEVSPAPGVLNLDRLLARVAAARAIGGEPLVILSYMPAWLGEPRAFGRDPTRVPPADPVAWQKLVHDVVRALATAPAPALRFEAWNEPDVPIFWQDTPQRWAETVVLSARAVAQVEQETGLDLAFGGPATAVPDPVYLASFLAAFRDPSLPLDFVSWHYYGNLPFLGPDGTEFGETEPVQPVIGQPNPFASPSAFGFQPDLMRQWSGAALAGSGRAVPPMLLNEWNLSSGGYDLRHDTHVGAAFAAGVLAEMQESGLEASSFFRANDTRTEGGDHGIVFVDGRRKPAWWTFWLWRQMASKRAAVDGTSEGLWAVASQDDDRLTLLVSSFSASQPTARSLDIAVEGLDWAPASATVRRIDAAHGDASIAEPVDVKGATFTLALPEQAIALVELRRTRPLPEAAADRATTARDGAGRPGTLPATGGGTAVSAGLVLLAVRQLLLRARRRPARNHAG